MGIRAQHVWLAATLLLSGCFYVSNAEFDEAWDRDSDSWPLGEPGDPEADCAPFNAAINPNAPDIRGDQCDSDCGREADADNDDHPDAADCDSTDPTVHPCAEDVDGDGIDHDCDGNDGPNPDNAEVCPRPDPSFPDAPPIALEDCPEELRTN